MLGGLEKVKDCSVLRVLMLRSLFEVEDAMHEKVSLEHIDRAEVDSESDASRVIDQAQEGLATVAVLYGDSGEDAHEGPRILAVVDAACT